MKRKTNRIPETVKPLLTVAREITIAAEQRGEEVGLKQNTGSAIRGDYERLAGRPADPDRPELEPFLGTETLYGEARVAHASARADQRAALAEGRAFVAQTVDTLKAFLGRRWNAQWTALGFQNGSLAVATDPHVHLLCIANFLTSNPQHQCEQFQITPERAEALVVRISEACGAAATAKDAEFGAKQARDAAVRQLRRRLTALRNELALLLDPDDSRWYRFGFRRPIDSRCPETVEEVTVSECAEGAVVVSWPAAVRAQSYRVAWRTSDQESQPEGSTLVGDLQTLIQAVPLGKEIIIAVSARNRTGESQPREAKMTIPPSTPSQGEGAPSPRVS